jgi:ribokinase
MRLTTDDILKAENVIKEADVVVAQLEVPADVITAGFKLAKKYGAITMLNPAPVTSHLPQEMIQYIDLLLPNETEAAALAQQNPTTDIEVIEKHAYPVFVELGFTNTIITLGAQGSYYHVGSYAGHVPIFPAEVVDTTAAGDTFIGNLAVHLNVDMGNVQSAVEWSSMASALAVSREGAIKSIPTKREIENTFKQYEVTP